MERPHYNPVTLCVGHHPVHQDRQGDKKGLDVCMNAQNVCSAQWGMGYLTKPINDSESHPQKGPPSSYNSYTLKDVPQRPDHIQIKDLPFALEVLRIISLRLPSKWQESVPRSPPFSHHPLTNFLSGVRLLQNPKSSKMHFLPICVVTRQSPLRTAIGVQVGSVRRACSPHGGAAGSPPWGCPP